MRASSSKQQYVSTNRSEYRVAVDRTREFLRSRVAWRDLGDLRAATSGSPTGEYRVEIPSVEAEVLDRAAEANARDVLVHRVSQGTRNAADRRRAAAMAKAGAARPIEVSLFADAGRLDTGAAALASGAGRRRAARGTEQLVHVLEDIRRTAESGIRSVLVTDIACSPLPRRCARRRAAATCSSRSVSRWDLRIRRRSELPSRPARYLQRADRPFVGATAAIRAAIDIRSTLYRAPTTGRLRTHFEIAEIVGVAPPFT